MKKFLLPALAGIWCLLASPAEAQQKALRMYGAQFTPSASTTMGTGGRGVWVDTSSRLRFDNGVGPTYVPFGAVTAKGDLISWSGSNWNVLTGSGVTNGYVLTFDSAEPGGIKWAVGGGGGSTLPLAYNAGGGGPQVLTLDTTRLGLFLRDASGGIGAALFQVQNNAGTTAYASVTTTGLGVGVAAPSTALHVKGSLRLSLTATDRPNEISASTDDDLLYTTRGGHSFVVDSDTSGAADMFNIYRTNTSGTPIFSAHGSLGRVALGEVAGTSSERFAVVHSGTSSLAVKSGGGQPAEVALYSSSTKRAAVTADTVDSIFKLRAESGYQLAFLTNGNNEQARITTGGITGFRIGVGQTPLSTATVQLGGTTGTNVQVSPELYFGGGTSNLIRMAANGLSAPAFSTPGAGYKLILNNSFSVSKAGWGFGIETGFLWSVVEDAAAGWKWYAGTTEVARLTGAGVLSSVHLRGTSSTPGIAAGAAAGTSPTVSVSGNDTAGVITVETGTSVPATGTLVTLTYAVAFANAPAVVVTPANDEAAAAVANWYWNSAGSSASAAVLSLRAALTDSTTYLFAYHAIGR